MPILSLRQRRISYQLQPESTGQSVSFIGDALLKSTGGEIFDSEVLYDSSTNTAYRYRYVVFKSSSTFSTNNAGTADILLVGGGGGGGAGTTSSQAGQGGSGAFVKVINSASFAANTNYTVTVGGAGAGGVGSGVAGANGTASTISSITGASANGGLRGVTSTLNYYPGNGAGNNYSGTASSTSAFVPGYGRPVDFLKFIGASSLGGGFGNETVGSNTYFGSGGASTVVATDANGRNYGRAVLGGGGGVMYSSEGDYTYFGLENAITTNPYQKVRTPLPNMGGGGCSGWRANTGRGDGQNGGSGLIVIRFKI